MGGAHRAELRHSPPLHFLQNSVILHGKTGYREGAEQDGAAADHGHSGGAISYLLTRKRVKNLNLRVRNGQVSLSMPLGCPAEEADAMVRAKCRWIIQALERQWAPGPGAAAGARPAGVPAAAGGGAGPGLSSGAAPWGGLAGAEAAPYEEPVGQLPLAQGYITLNTALARCPETLRDYVALHELVHFVHPDHGPGFYGLMDRLMPGLAAAAEGAAALWRGTGGMTAPSPRRGRGALVVRSRANRAP